MEEEEVLAQAGPISSKVQEKINIKFGIQLQSYLWNTLPLTGPWYSASDSLTVAEYTKQRVDREEVDVFKSGLTTLIQYLITENDNLKTRVTTLENTLFTIYGVQISDHESRITALENA